MSCRCPSATQQYCSCWDNCSSCLHDKLTTTDNISADSSTSSDHHNSHHWTHYHRCLCSCNQLSAQADPPANTHRLAILGAILLSVLMIASCDLRMISRILPATDLPLLSENTEIQMKITIVQNICSDSSVLLTFKNGVCDPTLFFLVQTEHENDQLFCWSKQERQKDHNTKIISFVQVGRFSPQEASDYTDLQVRNWDLLKNSHNPRNNMDAILCLPCMFHLGFCNCLKTNKHSGMVAIFCFAFSAAQEVQSSRMPLTTKRQWQTKPDLRRLHNFSTPSRGTRWPWEEFPSH